MTGLTKTFLHAIANFDTFIIFYRTEQRNSDFHIFNSIKRDNRMWAFSAFFFMTLLFEPGILFLQFCRIQHYYPGNFGRSLRTVYPAFESVFYQLWQKAAMVKMRMS